MLLADTASVDKAFPDNAVRDSHREVLAVATFHIQASVPDRVAGGTLVAPLLVGFLGFPALRGTLAGHLAEAVPADRASG